LLKKGDGRLQLNFTECTNYWTNICDKNISYISSLCVKMIQLEQQAITARYITKYDSNGNPYQEYDGIDSTIEGLRLVRNGNTLIPWAIDDYRDSVKSSNASYYYRQLSYMIFKELNGNISFPSPRTNDTVNGIYYFENHSLDDYFGFNTGGLSGSLQYVLDQYQSNQNTPINSFNDWDTDGPIWSGYYGNGFYFMFSVCTLHQINYLLYLGI
jgi:hypothetical protein